MNFPVYNSNRTQKLITEAIARKIPAMGGQQDSEDPKVHLKFFNPVGSWSWFLTELDPDSGLAFGKVYSGMCPEGEWGDFLLYNDEYPEESLAGIKVRGMWAIERDIHFKPCKASELKNPCGG
tara:strand:+ start:1577 stop:1945 length:369 start_codon:yes stop_codon:yes gene_type:complete